ncbi:MAG: hypothetical protein A2Y41_00655 [Spirochaetes bacterium GWB1_36_13]|nr:MAG: hypothetical protein A2Y41_00655 [Spirochaetes bacterium GWB1_36_13]
MKKRRRTVGTIIKWVLYSTAITVVIAPFILLIIEKTINLDVIKLLFSNILIIFFNQSFAEKYSLIIFSSLILLITFTMTMFFTRNTKIAVKIYANYDRIN